MKLKEMEDNHKLNVRAFQHRNTCYTRDGYS